MMDVRGNVIYRTMKVKDTLLLRKWNVVWNSGCCGEIERKKGTREGKALLLNVIRFGFSVLFDGCRRGGPSITSPHI